MAPDEFSREPVVVAVDPGSTIGWSVMQVHPEALSDPAINILDNITHWSEGEIVCGSVEVKTDHPSDKHSTRRKKIASVGIEKVDTWPESEGVHGLLGIIRAWPGCAVVVEDFVLRRFDQGRDLLSPVRLTAALEYALWRTDITIFRVSASEAKTSATDARLKMWGFYSGTIDDDHARDATRHTLTFLRKCKDLNSGAKRRHAAWPHIYRKDGRIQWL